MYGIETNFNLKHHQYNIYPGEDADTLEHNLYDNPHKKGQHKCRIALSHKEVTCSMTDGILYRLT